MRSHYWWVPYAFVVPALLGLVIFRLVPIAVAGYGSLTSKTLMGETVFVGLDNYRVLFNNPSFWSSVKITLWFNLLINPIQVAIALGLALLVFRPTRGVGLIRTIYFLPMTMALSIVSILWNLLLNPNLGLINGVFRSVGIPVQPFFDSPDQALGSLIWLATWKGVGYWMMFVLAGLNDIPSSLYEAAEIDGANSFRSFLHITLPLMRRPLAFVLVSDTVVNFLFFAPVYIITKGGPLGSTELLMYQSYRAAFVYIDMGRSLAISTCILFIIGLFTAIELRFFHAEEI